MNLTIERNGGGASWTKRRQKKRKAEREKKITQERERIVSLAHDRWRRTRTFGLTKNYLLSCDTRFGG
jgi:hypothetical protein